MENNMQNYQQVRNHLENLLESKIKPIILLGTGNNGKSYLANELDLIALETFDLVGTRILYTNEVRTPESLFEEGFIWTLNTLDGVENIDDYDVIDMNHIHF